MAVGGGVHHEEVERVRSEVEGGDAHGSPRWYDRKVAYPGRWANGGWTAGPRPAAEAGSGRPPAARPPPPAPTSSPSPSPGRRRLVVGEADEQVPDHVAVGAEDGGGARELCHQGADVGHRRALGQGGVDLDRPAAVAGEGHHRLQAAHVVAGEDAVDGELGQQVDQARPPGAAPSWTAAGARRGPPTAPGRRVGVADDEQGQRVAGLVGPTRNDRRISRSRS